MSFETSSRNVSLEDGKQNNENNNKQKDKTPCTISTEREISVEVEEAIDVLQNLDNWTE